MTDVARVGGPSMIDLLRDQIAPKATNQELAFFGEVCERLDLSPFRDEIVMVPRWNAKLGREVYRHQVTVHGRRVLAQRTGEVTRLDGPYWAGPRNPPGADLVWRDLWDEDGHPYAARFFVGRRGLDMPTNGTVKWSEFCQFDKNGKPLKMWQEMPSHMLGKTAESLALRRAFPEVLTADVLTGYDDAGLDIDMGDGPGGEPSARALAVGEHPDVRADSDVAGPSVSAPASPEDPPPHERDYNAPPYAPDRREPPPLVLTQNEAHAAIGALPKAQQLEFVAKHNVKFEAVWPDHVLQDAARMAQEPF